MLTLSKTGVNDGDGLNRLTQSHLIGQDRPMIPGHSLPSNTIEQELHPGPLMGTELIPNNRVHHDGDLTSAIGISLVIGPKEHHGVLTIWIV